MDERSIKQNIRYIDYFKALLMILVILGHINFANQTIKPWIYAFHMPAFFFASGMLLKDRPFQHIREYGMQLWKKFTGLMFPYFVWALIYASLKDSNLIRILYGSHQSLASAHSLTSLWFLPVLFEATTMFLMAQLVFNGKPNVAVKLILVGASFVIAVFLPTIKHGYPWCFNVSFVAFGFLLLGNLLFPVIQLIQKKGDTSKNSMTHWILIAFLAFGGGSCLYLLNVPQSGNILVANAKYGNFILFTLTAFFGTVFVMSLGILLDCFIPKSFSCKWDILSFLGQNTLCAFVVQKPIIRWFRIAFKFIRVPDAIALIITCLGTVIGCCLMALFINRYFPAMVGKYKEKS